MVTFARKKTQERGIWHVICIPYRPCDWYIYLHLVDFQSKCIGKYTIHRWYRYGEGIYTAWTVRQNCQEAISLEKLPTIQVHLLLVSGRESLTLYHSLPWTGHFAGKLPVGVVPLMIHLTNIFRILVAAGISAALDFLWDQVGKKYIQQKDHTGTEKGKSSREKHLFPSTISGTYNGRVSICKAGVFLGRQINHLWGEKSDS